MRRTTLLAAVLLLALILPGVRPGDAAAADRTFTYSIATRGSFSSNVDEFAAHVAATLADPRGWSLGGSIAYQRVSSGGDFTVWLAEASTVPGFSSVCSSQWSCRVGRNVIINETRWRTATPTWPLGLDEYRHYVVNHEMGHWLGLGHVSCPGGGQPAPVMQQQSKGLQGCAANTWPLRSERENVARRFGVSIVECTDRTTDPARAERFVAAAYRDLLGREADSGGLAHWTARMRDGLCRSELAGRFVRSTEGATRRVAALYLAYLARPADAGGMDLFRGVLAARGEASVALALLGSDEAFAAGGGSSRGYAGVLYERLLGRAGDPGGLDWIAGIVDTQGRGAAVAALYRSDESARRRAAALYEQILHRAADPGGLAHHARLLQANDDLVVLVGMVASAEYLARA